MSDDEIKTKNTIRIRHMLEASCDAVSFVADITLTEFENDRLRALAITRCIEIIGEAASAVTLDYRADHDVIPWKIIVAMRNRLIHAYFDVNLVVLWDTIHNDLPPLISSLEKILLSDNAPGM